MHADPTLPTGELRVEVLAECRELRVGGGGRDPVAHACHRGKIERPAILQVDVAKDERRPEIGPRRELQPARQLGATGKAEGARRDTDNREPLTAEGNLLAEDRWITRPATAPESVADQSDARRAGERVGVREVAADRRANA